MIVVDASVALKWFIPETDTSEEFEFLRCGQKLIGPILLRDEVVSGLVRRVRREELSVGETKEAVNAWLTEQRRETVHLIDDEALPVDAAELGFQLKHPLYDCTYLALANQINASMVTADKTF